MDTNKLANDALDIFMRRLGPLTAVHVTERLGDYTSPLSTLELDEDGGLNVIDLFSGDVKQHFLAGRWQEARTLLGGHTLATFTPPQHEFDDTDLALGREDHDAA